MNWINLSLVNTTREWQYTEPFEGDYVRIRHLLGVAPVDLPYGFTGLIAQAFDFANTVELFEIKKIYPKNEEGIFQVINPFPNQERRLAVRGQRKFQTAINWRINIEFWQDKSSSPDLDKTIALLEIKYLISTGFIDLNNRLDRENISAKLIEMQFQLDSIEQALNVPAQSSTLTTSTPQGRFFFFS